MNVYRWDLDKTYLDTDFQSFRGLVRTATEPAHKKRALPGAAVLLRALGEQASNRITVISGSPVQMRRVLSEKLRLDGVRFDELVLKDNLENVRRGRFRAVRGQMGYKLPALLEARTKTDGSAKEVLFGDDVEADALVYSVYADAIAGRIGAAEVSRVMERAGAYEDEIDRALAALSAVHRADAVERIFIRSERGVPTRRMAALGPRVVPIRSWWQAGVVLLDMGHVDEAVAVDVVKRVYELEGRDVWQIGALTQDLLRRGVVDPEFLLSLSLPSEVHSAMAGAVSAMRGRGLRPQAIEQPSIDYLELLASGLWNKHGKADTGEG